MVPTSRLSEQQLHALADDAFEVLNWARRHGLKRDQQVAEERRLIKELYVEALPKGLRP